MKVIPETYSEVSKMLLNYGYRDIITVSCAYCEVKVPKSRSLIKAAITRGASVFCTNKCFYKARSIAKPYYCKCCGEVVIRVPSAVVNSVFCNKSCAQIYRNKTRPGIRNKCKCGKRIGNSATFCKKCYTRMRSEETEKNYLAMTFRDFKISYNGDIIRYSGAIRVGSRRLAKKRGMVKLCSYCGYDTYVELCHIRKVADFPDDATMDEINSPENLVYLCPNHHKELDMGLLEL